MAEVARQHHENIQHSNLSIEMENLRRRTIEQVKHEIPQNQKFENPNSPLHDLLQEHHIHDALYSLKANSAAGIDGIPYELWKQLDQKHKSDQAEDKPSFDIVKTLTKIINDIQQKGVDEQSEFTLGWMCLIYKKKDRTEIENYRPITLLNTDYKILTKALAIQLAHELHTLVHQDQSGFIPKRSIFDPIRLAKTMIEYADITEEDGALIALDQEKAYDRINHDYLFEVLNSFNLPPIFINTVKALYNNAYTKVAINGIMSAPFKATRGVRQGDPLSCLLFDLAIEPLACTLRNSENLHGYKIPNVTNRIKINLYADGTTIFLSKEDKYSDLEEILSTWCLASGVKFNMEKTEIIPIGSKTHRAKVIATRKLNENDPPLDNSIKIAPDGHHIRSLGAWIGNKTDDVTPWEPILSKINNTLKNWNKSHPNLDGKSLITQMTVGGMTQFLTKAQGVPKHIESALIKTTRDFIWNNSHTPPISMEQLYRTKEEGGINLLDIKSRNQAIEITWVKAYLNLSPSRPTWAFIIDLLINNMKIKASKNNKSNDITFLQSWNPPTRGPSAKSLPSEAIKILQTAKKHNIAFAPIKMSKQIKTQLPAWLHLGAAPKTYHKTKNTTIHNRWLDKTLT
jgi:hypothetical protein